MNRSFVVRGLVLAGLVAAFALVAHPAAAQNQGGLRGVVKDDAGKPVADATVTLDFLGDYEVSYTVKTNDKGEFMRVGLRVGKWRVSAEKDAMKGMYPSATVSLNNNSPAPINVTIRAAAVGNVKAADPKMSEDEIKKRNARSAELELMVNSAIEAIDKVTPETAAASGAALDEAITKLETVAKEIPSGCAGCLMKIGDAYEKKGDLAKAEEAYKKVIDIDATKGDGYAALATLYNKQKRFDDASKMGAKAAELMGASAGPGGAAGGGDATALYNQGIILWNQSKAAEAQVLFDKATKADPKMADAFYFLGMTLVNQNKLKEAVEPFKAYMALAPTGKYADQVKALLDAIK